MKHATSKEAKKAVVTDLAKHTHFKNVAFQYKNMKDGEEVGAMEAWREPADEIEELKKVFFEFLKRWVENEGPQGDVNKPIIYERHKDTKEFRLQVDLREEEQA
jgi:hypothetical protein